MSSPRLSLLLLPVALGLPLLTGACGVPLGVAAASYGADGVSVVESGKTTTDHFSSMVSKKDCALWRAFRNRPICEDQDPSKPNPYKVSYDEPFRQESEGGTEYLPPAHAAANAPAASWDAAAYKPAPTEPAAPTTAVVETPPPPVVQQTMAQQPVAGQQTAAPVTHKVKPKKKVAAVKKPSPDQVASSH
jgi:hypothetical protein